MNGQVDKSARAALACGISGIVLWFLSYSWIPLSLIPSLLGRCPSFLDVFAYVIPISELGALVIGTIIIGLGVLARRRWQSGTPEHRSASRRLVPNVLVLVLVIFPNIVFPLLLDR